MNDGMLGQTAL